MEGKIYISGEVGVSVTLLDVISQVKKQEALTSLEVNINSIGGFVDEGMQIYNYLKGLQIPITTVASGVCASIATVIFLAGNKRQVLEGTKFMIHAPKVKPADHYNSAELKQFSDALNKIEKEIIQVYTENTTMSADEVQALLQKDTYMNLEQLTALGFVQDTQPIELRAVAKLNINFKNESMTAEDKSWLETKLEAFAKMFTATKVDAKMLMLQDATGVTVEFPDLAEDAIPVLGDVATVDGQVANGSYVMPSLNNATVVFIDGVVTEIIEAQPDGGEDELAKLKQENETLKAENERLSQVTAKLETEFKSFRATVTSKMATVEPKQAKADEPTEKSTSKMLENLSKIKKR